MVLQDETYQLKINFEAKLWGKLLADHGYWHAQTYKQIEQRQRSLRSFTFYNNSRVKLKDKRVIVLA